MTTQVAVANLDGIAVASDTLVTFGQKTLDGARKIYELGDGHQVLVMHSGNAKISGTSQYLHFVEWTKTLSEPLPKLTDYIESYLAWTALSTSLVEKSGQGAVLNAILNDHYYYMRNEKMYPPLTEDRPADDQLTDGQRIEIVDSVISSAEEYLKDLKNFPGVTLATAKKWLTDFEFNIDEKLDFIFEGYPISASGRAALRAQAPSVLAKMQDMPSTDSLIAFVGYGADESYPGVVRMRIRGLVDGHALAAVEDETFIDPHTASAVHYFAQADAMRALVNGAHHRVLSNLRRIIGQTLENRFADLEYREIVEILDSIFEKSAESSDSEFVQPYLDTMAAMGIGKLADLADSLIQLQLMSTHADTERTTIGGTIEVAIIDRQHGVRWVSKLKEDVLPGH